jgi:asparagine synthase (glutamine-hydrolysing)
MWGICGIVRFDGAIVSPAPVQAMMTSLAHRGRDDEGMWLDRGVGLGHRRLAIIDLSGGHQPMSNEADHIHVVLNGMIYNYQEFRRELLQAGHSFRTKSDTEILVHAFPPIANSRHRPACSCDSNSRAPARIRGSASTNTASARTLWLPVY